MTVTTPYAVILGFALVSAALLFPGFCRAIPGDESDVRETLRTEGLYGLEEVFYFVVSRVLSLIVCALPGAFVGACASALVPGG